MRQQWSQLRSVHLDCCRRTCTPLQSLDVCPIYRINGGHGVSPSVYVPSNTNHKNGTQCQALFRKYVYWLRILFVSLKLLVIDIEWYQAKGKPKAVTHAEKTSVLHVIKSEIDPVGVTLSQLNRWLTRRRCLEEGLGASQLKQSSEEDLGASQLKQSSVGICE